VNSRERVGTVILAAGLGKTSCRAAAGGRRPEGAGALGLAAPGGVRAAEAAILTVMQRLGPADERDEGSWVPPGRCRRRTRQQESRQSRLTTDQRSAQALVVGARRDSNRRDHKR
jgi:hypothetical protein